MKYYSKTTGGFYDPQFHTNIPADKVEISDDEHAALLEGQAKGKVIQPDEKGNPVLVDVPVPAVNLDTARTSAKAQLSAMLDTAATTLTGNTPLAEQLSWSVKQDAARAFVAGTATDEQKIILDAEASVTCETVEALCGVILESADTYASAVGKIAGLRRKVSKTIDDCDTVECVAKALAEVSETIRGALAE